MHHVLRFFQISVFSGAALLAACLASCSSTTPKSPYTSNGVNRRDVYPVPSRIYADDASQTAPSDGPSSEGPPPAASNGSTEQPPVPPAPGPPAGYLKKSSSLINTEQDIPRQPYDRK
jgi:hypothetical protein